MGKVLLILLLIFYTACPIIGQDTGTHSFKSYYKLPVNKFTGTDSSSQPGYVYKFNAGRVLGESAAGVGLGFVGMLAGGLLGKGLSSGETGEFAGFVETLIVGYLGYCAGIAGGVTLVANHYNSEVTFLSTFTASAGGAVAGISLVDWEKGGDWRASLPFIMPIIFSVISSEIFYPSRVEVIVSQNNIVHFHPASEIRVELSLSLN